MVHLNMMPSPYNNGNPGLMVPVNSFNPFKNPMKQLIKSNQLMNNNMAYGAQAVRLDPYQMQKARKHGLTNNLLGRHTPVMGQGMAVGAVHPDYAMQTIPALGMQPRVPLGLGGVGLPMMNRGGGQLAGVSRTAARTQGMLDTRRITLLQQAEQLAEIFQMYLPDSRYPKAMSDMTIKLGANFLKDSDLRHYESTVKNAKRDGLREILQKRFSFAQRLIGLLPRDVRIPFETELKRVKKIVGDNERLRGPDGLSPDAYDNLIERLEVTQHEMGVNGRGIGIGLGNGHAIAYPASNQIPIGPVLSASGRMIARNPGSVNGYLHGSARGSHYPGQGGQGGIQGNGYAGIQGQNGGYPVLHDGDYHG